MDIVYCPPYQLSDVQETNVFLRRVWARLRADLGLAFQYTPRRDSENQIQNIGYISLKKFSKILRENDIGDPVACSFQYKKRGVVDRLIFSIPSSWESCLNIDEVAESIKSSLSSAASDLPKNASCRVRVFTPIPLDLPNASGATHCFNGGTGEAELIFDVKHFDEVDFQDQASNFAWSFCVLASAWTGHLFFLNNDHRGMSDYRETLSLISDGELIGSVRRVSDQSFSEMIDLLINDSPKIKPVLRAAHLIQRSIFSASSSRDILGDTANALNMSALEVLSDEGNNPITCKSCGQPQYKISQRVRDYAAKHMGADHWRSWFGNKYTVRSKFLHTGVIRHKRVSSGRSNPTVQLSAPEGMAMPMVFSFDHVLAHFTLIIFRQHFLSITKQ